MSADGWVVCSGQLDSWGPAVISHDHYRMRPSGPLPWLSLESPGQSLKAASTCASRRTTESEFPGMAIEHWDF